MVIAVNLHFSRWCLRDRMKSVNFPIEFLILSYISPSHKGGDSVFDPPMRSIMVNACWSFYILRAVLGGAICKGLNN